MKCIICGCLENSACYHDGAGPCSWHSYKPAICSHCADPEVFNECERPTVNLRRVKQLRIMALITVFDVMNFTTKIEGSESDKIHIVRLITGDADEFEAILKAWYPTSGKHSPGLYKLDLSKQAILMYKQEVTV